MDCFHPFRLSKGRAQKILFKRSSVELRTNFYLKLDLVDIKTSSVELKLARAAALSIKSLGELGFIALNTSKIVRII